MPGLDSSIISSIGANPQPVNSFADTYAKMQAQRQAQQQNALAIQQGQMQVTQMKRSQEDEANARNLFKTNENPTDQAILGTLGPKAGGALLKSRNEARESTAKLQNTQAEVAAKHADLRGEISLSLSKAGPNLNGQAIQLAASQMAAAGDTQGAQQLTQAFSQGGPDAIKPLLAQAIGASPKVQEILNKEQETGIHTQNLEREKARDAQLAKHEGATEQAAQDTLAQTQVRDQQNAAYQAAEIKQGAARTAIEASNAKTAQQGLALRTSEYKQKYTPLADATEGQIKTFEAMARGLQPVPKGARGEGVREKVNAVSEALGLGSYTDSRYEANASFKTGKDQADLKALSTALEHAKRFTENSDKMGSLESATSGFGVNVTGNQKRLSLDGNLLSGEVGKLVTSGVVPEGELKQIQGDLKSSSNSVRKAAADELLQLSGGKLSAMVDKYESATGMKFDPSLISDKTHKALNSMGIDTRRSQAAAATTDSNQQGPKKYKKGDNPLGI